jgi:plastocyanin
MKMDDSSNSSASSGDASQATATNEVEIEDYAFKPGSITVKKGTTVKWTNKDDVQHDIVADTSGSGLGSELLSKGQSYSFTFDTAGAFTYHCGPHPYMKGTVTVTE